MKLKQFSLCAGLITALTLFAVSGWSADVSSHDKQFVTKAAQAGHAEIAAGKVGASQASSAGVKKFSEQLVQDHTKAGDELAQIAQSKGLKVPDAPDAAHQRELDNLKKLSGSQFDRRFAENVGVKDHQAAVKLFQDEAKNGRDAELKAFAEKTLPTLKEHLTMARDLVKETKGAK